MIRHIYLEDPETGRYERYTYDSTDALRALLAARQIVLGGYAVIGDDASIGDDAAIGNGASIGYGAVIGDGAVIGNRAAIGDGAIIGYGSSIGGDASIGQGVVIGPGVVIGDGQVVTSPGAEARERPVIPVVPRLATRMLEAIRQDGCALDMSSWHTCDTTHCWSGWAIHLAGEPGYALERFVGPWTAGHLIIRASCPYRTSPPDFYATDATALADIEADAATEARLSAETQA